MNRFKQWDDWFPRPPMPFTAREWIGEEIPVMRNGDSYVSRTDGNIIVARKGETRNLNFPDSAAEGMRIYAEREEMFDGFEIGAGDLRAWCGEPLAPSVLCDTCGGDGTFGTCDACFDDCIACHTFGVSPDYRFVIGWIAGVPVNAALVAVTIPFGDEIVRVAGTVENRGLVLCLDGDDWYARVMQVAPSVAHGAPRYPEFPAAPEGME